MKIHTDAAAEASALALGARAYTVRSHVFFAHGEYAPDTKEGLRLLAHELVHVVQQGQEQSLPTHVGQPSDPLEQEAESVSAAVASGRAARRPESGPVNAMRSPTRAQRHEGPALLRAPAAKPTAANKPAGGSSKLCGPDVTQWFIDVVNKAKATKDILRIKTDIIDANALMTKLGLPDIMLLAEFFVDKEVTEAWERAGKPPEKGEAKSQRLSAASGFMAMAQAELKVARMDAMQLALLVRARSLLKDAALTWRALIEDQGPYDFKNKALAGAHSAGCPADCKGTITLCDMCFLAYVTGDLFYAHVGRFVGWSDLSLRLGSQYAQLISKKKDWDPPEDSAMLTIGLHLPDPLTAKALCSALQSQGGQFTEQCVTCGEPWSAP